MKKMLMAMMAAAVGITCLADVMSLADARAKIGDVVANPSALTALMKQLSADDQKAYLAEVNAAVAKMPGSNESKAATFLNVNKAALKGAQKGNLTALIAEVFATVPMEVLTVINESFAADLFNRGADPSKKYTDEEFVAISTNVMAKVAERNANVDNAAVRDAFALLMMVRASNGLPVDLSDTLLKYIPEASREVAKSEWLPQALSSEKSYEAMLGAADAGLQPNQSVVMRIAGPQLLDFMLTDLETSPTDKKGFSNSGAILDAHNTYTKSLEYSTIVNDGSMDTGLNRIPFYYNRKIFYTDIGSRGNGRKIGEGPSVTKEPIPAPPGSTIGEGGAIIGPGGVVIVVSGGYIDPRTGKIMIPAGTTIAPGGVPVGPDGQPIGPGGQVIYPGQRDEPGGYQYQY